MNQFLEFLRTRACQNIVVCPGGRNKAVIDLLTSQGDFNIETFYDERSAAFYALGLSQVDQEKTVALVVTSGSALAECLPAVIEGHYQKQNRLIVISADRPPAIRNSGAPQTIPQAHVLNVFARSIYDVHDIDRFDESSVGNEYPIHINLCLSDPNKSNLSKDILNLDSLLILGALESEDTKKIETIFRDYSGFLILESFSNLSPQSFPNAKLISCPDQVLSHVEAESFKKIVRLGGVPVTRFWRDLGDKEIFYWNAYPYSGTLHGTGHSLEDLKGLLGGLGDDSDQLLQINEGLSQQLSRALESFPNSETALLRDLQDQIPEGSFVFVGNSLPVREWQLLECRSDLTLCGQRGVNGIDGSLSYALGRAGKRDSEIWVVLGDLTSLYDFSGFWTLRYLKNKKVRVIVVNNFGGKIFHKIFRNEILTNSHEHGFEFLARQWGIDYRLGLDESGAPIGNHALIELRPDLKQSDDFWNEFEQK